MSVKISQLPVLNSLGASNVFPVVSGNTTYQVSASVINTYITTVMSTANVTGGNLSITGTITGATLASTGTISASGNITGANLNAAGLSLSSNVISALNVTSNITGGNLRTGGSISATGNITGGNVLGGANVNATTHTGTTVSVTANVTGGNILTGGIVSATGNITGNYLLGNGSALTGITGLASRGNVTVYSGSIANAAVANVTAVGYKGYVLYGITTTANAWVTVYTSTSARTADSSRTITTDPTPGSGVVGEVITSSTSTQFFTPAVTGFSTEASPDSNVQLKIVNISGGTANIGVTLTLLKLEN